MSELVCKEHRSPFQFLVSSHHSNIPYGEQRFNVTPVAGIALEKTIFLQAVEIHLIAHNFNSLNSV